MAGFNGKDRKSGQRDQQKQILSNNVISSVRESAHQYPAGLKVDLQVGSCSPDPSYPVE